MTAKIRLKRWWIYGVATSGFLFFALSGVALAAAPNQPTNDYPYNGAAFYTLTPTLEGSIFSDPDGDSHKSTQWQVRLDGTLPDYSTTVWNYNDTDASKTTETVAAGKLEYAKKYWWRIRYEDQTGAWSPYSAETNFMIALEPPQNVRPLAVTPISITWQWDNPSGNPSAGMTYYIFVKNSSGEFIQNGISTGLTYAMTLATDHNQLDYETLYEIKVLANHDDYGQSSLSSSGSGTTLMQSCTNGLLECRKGEVCYNYDTDPAHYKCARFNRCQRTDASCYLSVCDSGGANCYPSSSNLSNRIFSQSPGICRNNICDLYATLPNTPKICKYNDTNCVDNTSAVGDVFVRPRFKWIDSDPRVEFNDYRSSLVAYAGDETRYQVELATAGVTTTYDWTDFANLDWLSDTERYLDLSQLISGEQYLEYGTTYYWRVRSEAQNPAPAKIVVGPVWQFTTTSLCSVLNFDYDPAQYLASQYAPDNVVTNSAVIYPVNTRLEWIPDPDYASSLAGANYELRVQECNADYSVCEAFTTLQNSASDTYRFGEGNPYLEPNKIYRWQVFITRGATVTSCAIYEFKTGALPEIVLNKRLLSLREGEVTYKIDFYFNIPDNALRDENIFDFEVTDNFNTNIVNSITTDDVLVDAYPVGLRVATLTAGASSIKWQIVRPSGSGGSGGTPAPAGPDPIAWWKMDEASWNGTANEVVDSSGNANHGTSYNGANTTAAGKYDRAGNFDGIDDDILLSSSSELAFSGNVDYTISGWMKTPTATYPTANSALAGKWGDSNIGYMLYFTSLGRLQIFSDFSWCTTNQDAFPADGNWHHVAGVKSGANCYIYVDGSAAITSTFSDNTITNMTGKFEIGSYNSNSGANFAGLIDDVRVFDQALTQAQITDAMNNAVTPPTPPSTVAATNSMSVFSHGSLILVVEEKPALPACTFITNRAQAQGKTTGSSLFNVSAQSNAVSHLAGSGNIDPGYLATKAGDIHSNASICLSKAPASGFYVADYFVTAKGSISKDTSLSRAGENYVKEGWQEIDDDPSVPGFKDIHYETLYGAVDVVKTGECSVLSLFGATSGINLNGQIYRCQSGIGGTDFNDDEIATNGDLIINDSMLINHNGGSGTVIVDGNLFINHDIKYTNTSSLTDVSQLASIGWIVRGDIFIKEYFIDAPGTCAKAPQKPWCDAYHLVDIITPALGAPYPVLAYGQLFVAPVEIVGVFFSENTIYTGRAHIPLLVRGSLIADEIKLERLSFPSE